MTIRDEVARALSDTRDGRPEPGQLYNYLATAAITAFLAAAAEQGGRMRNNRITREMKTAGDEAWMEEKPASYIYRAMLAAAPEFEWDK